MPPIKHKAFAFITHAGRLLMFRHPFSPEAGIQVPAGTVEVNELPADAVMREAFEETGLRGLELLLFLGNIFRIWRILDWSKCIIAISFICAVQNLLRNNGGIWKLSPVMGVWNRSYSSSFGHSCLTKFLI